MSNNTIRRYTPRPYPVLEGSERLFIEDELKRIRITLDQIIDQINDLKANQPPTP